MTPSGHETPRAVRVDRMVEADLGAVAALDPSARLGVDQLQAELARPFSYAWVAREDETDVVGYAVAWLVVDELHLLNLATRPDRRRRGVARGVLTAMLRFARERSVRRVLLEVRRSNDAAIALYGTVGFVPIGVRQRYYPDDEDALDMALDLG